MDDFEIAETKKHSSRRRRPKKVIVERDIAHQYARLRRKWAGWRIPFLRSPFFSIHPVMPFLLGCFMFLGYLFLSVEVFHHKVSSLEFNLLIFFVIFSLIYTGFLNIVRKESWRKWGLVRGSAAVFDGKLTIGFGITILILYLITLLIS